MFFKILVACNRSEVHNFVKQPLYFRSDVHAARSGFQFLNSRDLEEERRATAHAACPERHAPLRLTSIFSRLIF